MAGAVVRQPDIAVSSCRPRKGRSGQAMIEYVIVFVALFATILSLAVFLYAVRQQSNRTLDLVSSDYP